MANKKLKVHPGISVAVNTIFIFQLSPLFILYMRADTNPEIQLNIMKNTIITVPNAPRLDGDKKPRTAKTI
jgi:hypothetical protein